MAILNDVELIGKKILITIVIYLMPVTIMVGGLLLTKYLLDDESEKTTEVESKTSLLKQ